MSQTVNEGGSITGNQTIIDGENSSSESNCYVKLPVTCGNCGNGTGATIDYTEEEQFTGMYWRVGEENKKIYQRTVEVTFSAFNTKYQTLRFSHGIDGMDILVDFQCMASNSITNYLAPWPLNIPYSDISTLFVSAGCTPTHLEFQHNFSGVQSETWSCYVTLQYTCTDR